MHVQAAKRALQGPFNRRAGKGANVQNSKANAGTAASNAVASLGDLGKQPGSGHQIQSAANNDSGALGALPNQPVAC